MVTFKRLCLVFATAGLLAGVSTASIIYSDDFSGSGSVALAGTTPDVTTNGATWAGLATGWMSDGKIAAEATTLRRNVFLPFTPEAGKIYTAKLDVVRLATMSDFMEFGFVTNAVYGAGFPVASQGLGASPWMASYAVNGNVGTWTGPASDGSGTQATVSNADTFNTLEMVLDTTAAAWKVDFVLNGTTIRSETLSSNPDIR